VRRYTSGALGNAADTAASKTRGTLVSDMPVPDTIADGGAARVDP
jgi:hypothetical protein